MAAGLVLSVVQSLLAAVQCTSQLKELSSMFGYKSQLENLESTVNMIKALLLEAEIKNQELTHEGRVWFEELKDAVYDADDFFDELNTKVQLKRLSQQKILKKVRRFHEKIVSAFHTSQKIKMFREKLDSIADNRSKFGFSGEYRPVKRREETCSYVYEKNIIGRDDEKKDIIDKLLSDLTSVSFVSIWGMGGLGKTTLAHLVYNDERIRDVFSDGMYWVCVSEEFGLEEILCKLLDKKKNSDECTLEYLQKQVCQKIEGKKCLLILDDVWEEDPVKWHKLKEYLCLGGVGSRILVTTRSRKVAEAVDKDFLFELKGLSDENSWQLFKKIAFGEKVDDYNTRLVEIGKDIVKKCANVPLSIKVISSLLYGQNESKWEEFRNINLANMSRFDKEDHIMSSLMFSYYSLTPELKSCFSICSLFKKDYEIKKQTLISLWMAEGFLVPHSEGENMEDIGEEYFWILLQRGFFQDVERDAYGEIHCCKMHDLMHDLASKVAGKESSLLMASSTHNMNKKFRHLSDIRDAHIDSFYSKDCPSRQTLRTIFNLYGNVNLAALFSNCRRLRVLHLGSCDMVKEVGKLLHLRYIHISYSHSLKRLPRSITKLHNLQILNLSRSQNLIELPQDIGKLVHLRILDVHGCRNLKNLPEKIGQLVNLRIFNINGCEQLTKLPDNFEKLVNLKTLHIHPCSLLKRLQEEGKINYNILYPMDICKIRYMPVGMNKLINLQKLTYFVVGGDCTTKVAEKGELMDLKGLVDLKGDLHIELLAFSSSNKPKAMKGARILSETRLKGLSIYCESADDQGEFHETLLEGLYPNNVLETLVMSGYQGVIFPNWGEGQVTFPSGLVRMLLERCVGLKHLSSSSELVNLKYLDLSMMKNLEYIEKDAPCVLSETFFPSLESLVIYDAEKLKGWWKDVTWKEKNGEGGSGCLVDVNDSCIEPIPSFPRLCDLKIKSCKSLKYFPPCPQLKKLEVYRVNEGLHFCGNPVTGKTPSTSSSSSYLSSTHSTSFCLEELKLLDVDEFFNSSFLGGRLGNLTDLKSLKIWLCRHLESLGEDDDKEGMPWKSLTSLSSLELVYLPILVKIPKGFQYLTSLRSLNISDCPKLEMESIMWKSLESLSSLQLKSLPQLVNLPTDIQQLSSLQSLKIEYCVNLEGLGESLGSLTSLQYLLIDDCPQLKSLPQAMLDLTSLTELEIYNPSSELQERCQTPNGEDWPKICHIRHLRIQ